MNILFVCTGNTCRSPMAAGLMNKVAVEKNLDVRIESAGLFANEGENASSEAIIAMHSFGVDLTGHHAQMINEELIEKSDLILTMTPAHKMVFEGVAGDKTYTLCEYAGIDGDIDDPFGGDVDDYIKTAEEIQKAVLNVAKRIEEEL